MAWTLDSDRPIYAQLVERLTLMLLTGRYPPGSRLPSVRDLASEAGVNPNTMQRALTQLEDKGLVSTQRTTGRTVTEEVSLLEHCRKELAHERTSTWCDGMAELGYAGSDLRVLLENELTERNG